MIETILAVVLLGVFVGGLLAISIFFFVGAAIGVRAMWGWSWMDHWTAIAVAGLTAFLGFIPLAMIIAFAIGPQEGCP